MRSRLVLAGLFLAPLPAFSQNFDLKFTGGAVNFGTAPIHIVITPQGFGTQGTATSAPGACGAIKAVTLGGGAHPFSIRGMSNVAGDQWEVVFKFQGGANQGNLSAPSSNWELTGKYEMKIKDLTTNAVCTTVVAESGEYQFEGPPLLGWPKLPGLSCQTKGQSPRLAGTMTLHGHANIHPLFTPGGSCTAALAAQANAQIGAKGFDTVKLDYTLNY
jgi:hypothetical protein